MGKVSQLPSYTTPAINDYIPVVQASGPTLLRVTLQKIFDLFMPLIYAAIYRVGCVYTETTGVNPGTTFGVGTWVAYGQGKVLVGKATSGTFGTAGATGGKETHLLTSAESGVPTHVHAQRVYGGGGAGTGYQIPAVTSTTWGGSVPTAGSTYGNTAADAASAHNNLQPYVVVYMWTRTA